MSYDRAPPSTQSRLKEAVDWLVPAIERTHPQTISATQTAQEPVGVQAILKQKFNSLTRSKQSAVIPANSKIDRQRVEQSASDCLKRGVSAATAEARSIAEVVEMICNERNSPESAQLARAWLQRDDTELKGVHMETKWLMLIGVAAGAAVLALVLLARRKSSITVYGRQFRVSKDFSALQRVRDQDGPAAAIARKIIDSELSPWDFALEPAVHRLSLLEKRTLLSALAPLDVGVESFSPSPGESFDPDQMSDDRVAADGSRWVVAASPKEDDLGFRLRGRLEVRAKIDACTADWWCLALADAACPIAAAVRADPDQYIGLEAKYASCWSIVQGFSAFADLRVEFDEGTLRSWSTRLHQRLSQWYSASSGRLPIVFGAAGDRYDPSVMKSVDGAHEAHARVVAVEERDELPQVGLGCVGSPPLLYAVVRVEER